MVCGFAYEDEGHPNSMHCSRGQELLCAADRKGPFVEALPVQHPGATAKDHPTFRRNACHEMVGVRVRLEASLPNILDPLLPPFHVAAVHMDFLLKRSTAVDASAMPASKNKQFSKRIARCVPWPETLASDVCCKLLDTAALHPLPGTNSFTALAFKSDSTLLPLWSEAGPAKVVPRGGACVDGVHDGVHSLADVDKR